MLLLKYVMQVIWRLAKSFYVLTYVIDVSYSDGVWIGTIFVLRLVKNLPNIQQCSFSLYILDRYKASAESFTENWEFSGLLLCCHWRPQGRSQ